LVSDLATGGCHNPTTQSDEAPLTDAGHNSAPLRSGGRQSRKLGSHRVSLPRENRRDGCPAVDDANTANNTVKVCPGPAFFSGAKLAACVSQESTSGLLFATARQLTWTKRVPAFTSIELKTLVAAVPVRTSKSEDTARTPSIRELHLTIYQGLLPITLQAVRFPLRECRILRIDTMKHTFVRNCLLLSLLVAVFACQAPAAQRPNILWIYLEDVSGWFSSYGETLIETPNIDKLADSGIRFTRFYTPAGVCSATRSSIVTGMMQTTIGAHNHRSARANFRGKSMGEYDKNVLPKQVLPLPMRFREAGYWTFNEGGKDDYNFEWSKDEFYNFERSKGGWGPPSLVAGDVWRDKKKDQPFFGQVQLGGGKLNKAAPRVIDRSKVTVPPYYPDIPEVREEIAHHYDCLLKTDEQVGEVIAALKRDGFYDNTLIFLFSDHGMKLHRHKQFLYEGGIQMPLIVVGPGIKQGGVRRDLISGIDISAASLAASGIGVPDGMEGLDFLAADYEPRGYIVAARDRCDYTIEKIRAIVTPRFKYLRNYLTDRPYMQPSYKDPWPVSIRFREMMAKGEMNAAQLVFFGKDRPAEELYDLENDPHEIHNLAGDPKYADELVWHRKILANWITETGDKGQQPESDIGLLSTLKRWGDLCVNPEYDKARDKLKSSK
jgi:N-sulfoglucosamine sulfohydrolase